MKLTPRARLALAVFTTVLSTLVALLATQQLIGQVARAVDLIAVFFGAFGAGAGTVAVVREVRAAAARPRA